MNILFAASEAYPFIKTGGLGDVVHSLPLALSKLGHDVRLVLPAYHDVLAAVEQPEILGHWNIRGAEKTHQVKILKAHQQELGDYLYLLDVPALFDRPGNPYVHEDGQDWPDNAERFTVFCRAVAEMAKTIPGSQWRADVVHCHDWQTGLVPAFLSLIQPRPAVVFTIHNLAYDGYFSYQQFTELALPPEWWSPDSIEFYGGLSMLKAGMIFSDYVTTVSPTYAREICTPEFGYRYEGILQHLGQRLTGILNGIDMEVWNPETDPHLAVNYRFDKAFSKNKLKNKHALLQQVGLSVEQNNKQPLIGFIGRLVEQKGIDMIVRCAPIIFETSNANMVILGSGNSVYESALQVLAKRYPSRLYIYIGYSEALAHQIEAGCDMFLMPSRFEPCGLNQMYSLRYGTPPIVHYTGGLADTITDTTDETLNNKTANGFVFDYADDVFMIEAIKRAISCYKHPSQWRKICKTAMSAPLGWEKSAEQYQKLYQAYSELP